MSVANKKRLARIKGINWKKVIFWIFNIVCYIITFIFTVSLIFGTVKGSNSQKINNSVIDYDNKPISSAYVSSETVILYQKDSRIPFDFSSLSYEDAQYSYCDVVIDGTITQFSFDEFDLSDYVLTYVGDVSDVSYILNLGINGLWLDTDEPYYGWDSITFSYVHSDNRKVFIAVKDSVDEYYYGNPNNTIFDTIGDTIPSFVSTINDGLGETFTIFYDDGLTTIGYLTTIVVAVTLGYFALRMIMGLIRLRG